MGNLVRACLGRDYSMSHSQQNKTSTLSWDLVMMFKVMCYVLFDVSPRGSSGAYSEDNARGLERDRRCSAPSPANLLRLLYRRHVLKSKALDTLAFGHCQTMTTTTTSCKFPFDILDEGSSIYGEKEIVRASPSPQSGRALEVFVSRLNSEVQTLKSKMDRQEEEVRRLTEEVVTLRANAAAASAGGSSPEVKSPKSQSPTSIVSSEAVLETDDPSSYTDHHPSSISISTKGGGHLVKLENVYMFEPAVGSKLLDDRKPVDEVRLCTCQDGANLEHLDHAATTTDLQSPVRAGTKVFWEHCPLEDHQLSPLKVQSDARKSFHCKCGDYIDAASAAAAATRTEIDVDDLDNLSMWSFESADTRDFQSVGTPPKCFLRRGDEYQEQVEWSSEESSKDQFMLHRDSFHWTNTDPGTGAKRRHVQPRHSSELEEQLLKILQSPRREILPQIISTNSSSCTNSGSSSPRSTSSVSGQSGLFWEPCRKTEGSITPQHLPSDKKTFDSDIDFGTEKRKRFRALSSTKGQTHHSLETVESSGGDEFVPKHFPLVPSAPHGERLVSPEISTSRGDSTQAHGQACANPGRKESAPPVDQLGEEDCSEVDLVEVALETFKVCKTGDICMSDNRSRSRHEREDGSILYRESQCNCTSSMTHGINHLKRHASFSGGQAGARQSRFGVEAARLSRRKHQRGCSF